MKGLDSIIRLNEWKLDEKRRKVADLERFAQRLHGQLISLDKEVKAEQKVAAGDPMSGSHYANYAHEAIRRREKILKSLADIESEMSRALDEVAAAFREFKKFDMIRRATRNAHWQWRNGRSRPSWTKRAQVSSGDRIRVRIGQGKALQAIRVAACVLPVAGPMAVVPFGHSR